MARIKILDIKIHAWKSSEYPQNPQEQSTKVLKGISTERLKK